MEPFSERHSEIKKNEDFYSAILFSDPFDDNLLEAFRRAFKRDYLWIIDQANEAEMNDEDSGWRLPNSRRFIQLEDFYSELKNILAPLLPTIKNKFISAKNNEIARLADNELRLFSESSPVAKTSNRNAWTSFIHLKEWVDLATIWFSLNPKLWNLPNIPSNSKTLSAIDSIVENALLKQSNCSTGQKTFKNKSI
jgi:hypothetical protein